MTNSNKSTEHDNLQTSVLTFGETLLKLALPSTHRLEQLTQLSAQCAGAELNVAAALVALGRPAAWVSALPDNALGDWARGHVRSLGVQDLSLIKSGRLGSFYLEDHHAPRPSRVIYDRAGSSFTHLSAADYQPSWLGGRAALHVSGISLALGAGPRELALKLMQGAKASGLTVSFDVNHRRLLLSDEQVPDVYGPALALADLIFVAERDTPLLGGLENVRRQYPQAVIVETRGAAGSYALSPDGTECIQAALPTAGPGRIGRGDTFDAAFLHRHLGGAELNDALAFAAAAAALKTTTPGDQLPATEADVFAVLSGSGGLIR